jgi:cobalt-zinc-cadmium efflux system membrane fusion protein
MTGPRLVERVFLSILCLVFIACGGERETDHAEKGDERSHKEDHQEAKEEKGHKEDASGSKEAIKLSGDAIKNMRVATAEVNLKPAREKITATATISHNQDRLFHVTPQIAGRVVEVYASVGKSVSSGERLALLDSTTMGETKSELMKAKTLLELAKANYEREKSLFEQKIAAQKDVLAAEADYRKAEAELRSLQAKLKIYGVSEKEISNLDTSGNPSRVLITAPAPGVVIEREISQGEVVETGKKVFTISDLSTVWIFVDIYERDLGKIKKGTEVALSVNAYPDKVFQGVVDHVGDVINPETRTVQVRLKVPNPARQLKPGMFATATFEGPASDAAKKAAYVPTTAVFDVKGKKVVFVQDGANQFHAREVEAASIIGNQAEITKGLKEGDRVVTEGGIYLKSTLLKEELGHGH